MKRVEVKKIEMTTSDMERLACKVLGINYDEINKDTETLENELYYQFETDLNNFSEIVSRLFFIIENEKTDNKVN